MLAAAGPPGPASTEGGAARIDCALDGAEAFKPVCAVDRAEVDGALILIVRHPDGGFRRFEVLKDGHGLAAADGADEAKLSIDGQFLVAEVDGDRYRFPATIGGKHGAS